MEYINHLTLNTGHMRKSYKNEIDKSLFFILNRIFEDSISKEGSSFYLEGKNYRAQTTIAEGCGVTTLFSNNDIPILTSGYSDENYAVFHLMKKEFETDKVKILQPPLPYIIDKIEVGMVIDPTTANWTGDFSRCIAWMAMVGKDMFK